MRIHQNIAISLISAAILLISAGCGTTPPVTTGGGEAATLYARLTNGNTWLWNASNSMSGLVNSTTYYTWRDTYGAAVPASGTQVTVTYTASAAIPVPVTTTEYIQFDTSQNLIRLDASGTPSMILPAAFGVGTTFTIASTASSALIGTISGINMTKTVAAGTFFDVAQIDLSGTVLINNFVYGASGSIYMSKTAFNMIYKNQVLTYPASGAVLQTITDTLILQPGYTAL